MISLTNTKYTIGICIPFFGKFNPWFYVWLKSAASNKTIDFLIFSDDTSVSSECEKYSNIHFVKMTLPDLNLLIKEKIHPKASIKNPYKLCDYKPTYGKLFEDYLEKYDYWGYCDVDLIFGDIRHFITDELLEKNDHILFLGHFSINKNCEKINNLFRIKLKNKEISYPYPFYKRMYVTVFDEIQFNNICNHENIRQCNNYDWFSDVNPLELGFINNNKNKLINNYFIVFWKDGKIYCQQANDDIAIEQLYVHFQKRSFCLDGRILKNNEFYIVPNKIIEPNENIDSYAKIQHDDKYSLLKRREKRKRWLKVCLKRKIQYLIYRGR